MTSLGAMSSNNFHDMPRESLVTQIATPDNVVVFTALIDGMTPSRIFACWTQPDLITQWWPPVAIVQPHIAGIYDSYIGGSYQFDWPGMGWTLRGTYLQWEPTKALVFTWAWDHQPAMPTRTVVLEVAPHFDLGTTLRLTQGPYSNSSEDQADRQSHIDGWSHFLPKLAALTE